MLSSMDHLFCLRVRHVLILVPASLRDLHRHSCRHFHFHFWLSLRWSYLHFVSRWISFLSPPPSLARAFVRFCFPPLSSVLFFSFFFSSCPLFFLSLFSYLSLQRAFSFLASATNGIWRSRQTQNRRLLALRFSASPSSLQPLRSVPRRDETGIKREREDFLDRAEGDRWAPHREIERRKGNTRKKCKVSRAHSRALASQKLRGALSKARLPFSLNWQKSIC